MSLRAQIDIRQTAKLDEWTMFVCEHFTNSCALPLAAVHPVPCARARSARAHLHELKMSFLCGGGSSAGAVLTEEEKKAAATAKKTLKAQAEADEKARCTLPNHPS